MAEVEPFASHHDAATRDADSPYAASAKSWRWIGVRLSMMFVTGIAATTGISSERQYRKLRFPA